MKRLFVLGWMQSRGRLREMFLVKPGQRLREGWPRCSASALAILIVLLLPSAGLPSQIHFDIDTPTDGSISWAGGNVPLLGEDIQVDQVMGLEGTLDDDTPYALTNGILNFQTGPWAGVHVPINYPGLGTVHRWTFPGGGELTLTGGVDLPGTNLDIIAPDILMTGEFSFCDVTYTDFLPDPKKWAVTIAGFRDEKHENLSEYYFDKSVAEYGGRFNISFEVTGDPDPTDGFESSAVLSGDISNYPIPVPAAAWLLGSGVIGLVVVRRRFDE